MFVTGDVPNVPYVVSTSLDPDCAYLKIVNKLLIVVTEYIRPAASKTMSPSAPKLRASTLVACLLNIQLKIVPEQS